MRVVCAGNSPGKGYFPNWVFLDSEKRFRWQMSYLESREENNWRHCQVNNTSRFDGGRSSRVESSRDEGDQRQISTGTN